MRKNLVVVGSLCVVVGGAIAAYGYMIDPGGTIGLESGDVRDEVMMSRAVLGAGGVIGLIGLILIALGFDRVHSSPRA